MVRNYKVQITLYRLIYHLYHNNSEEVNETFTSRGVIEVSDILEKKVFFCFLYLAST